MGTEADFGDTPKPATHRDSSKASNPRGSRPSGTAQDRPQGPRVDGAMKKPPVDTGGDLDNLGKEENLPG